MLFRFINFGVTSRFCVTGRGKLDRWSSSFSFPRNVFVDIALRFPRFLAGTKRKGKREEYTFVPLCNLRHKNCHNIFRFNVSGKGKEREPYRCNTKKNSDPFLAFLWSLLLGSHTLFFTLFLASSTSRRFYTLSFYSFGDTRVSFSSFFFLFFFYFLSLVWTLFLYRCMLDRKRLHVNNQRIVIYLYLVGISWSIFISRS